VDFFRHDAAYKRGEDFRESIGRFQRPMFLVAHHDDEISMAGLLQRLGPRTRVVWVTNSDGLYFELKMDPLAYGELRKAEGLRSLAVAGIPEENARCLDFSEVEIYRSLSRLDSRARRIQHMRPFFQKIRDAVRDAVFEARPDAIFTLAWQGGQPEHDLTHFFTSLAIRDLERETGRKIEYFHAPGYEYTILIAQRFHPLYRGERLRLRLTPEELAVKLRMIECYPSQSRLFGDFRKVFDWIGRLGRWIGGPRTIEEYLSTEEFGPVPAALDYTAKPHVSDRLTYMFDHFEGVPVTYKRAVRPIIKTFLR
jgi:LmbE family N-acetylglucosaminyl deacetylase